MFFDTEFSNFESPKLLSLGGVYSTRTEFYVEEDKIIIEIVLTL
jgi:hypothetical protein